MPHDGRRAPRWEGESRDDAVGPQGAALILELQRLRQAFEQEDGDAPHAPQTRRPAREELRPPSDARTRQPKRQRKGRMSRAFDICLEQLGLTATAPAARRSENVPEPAAAPTWRRSEPAPEPAFVQTWRRSEHVSDPVAAPIRRRSEQVREPAPAPVMRRSEQVCEPAVTPVMRRTEPVRKEAAPPTARRSEPEREPTPAPPPGRRGPIIAPDDPSLINAVRPGAESPAAGVKNLSMHVESPRLSLPPPAVDAKPATAVGQLMRTCRVGLTAGVAFLVNREGLADNDNEPGEALALRAGRAFENELRTGLRVLLVFILVAGGLAVLMPIAGAVVVPGNLVVQSNVKAIQHPTGGVVAEIPVHNGERVATGDLLLRLDATQAQASLQMVSKQLDEVRARIARLVAERDGAAQLQVPPELAARSEDATVKALLATEQSLFKARSNARRSQTDLLQSRVSQLGEEIAGLNAQVDSKSKQLELISGELTGVQDLYDKRLVPLTRLTTLQRESARIEGERGQLTSGIAETKSKIGEAQLQIVRLDQDFRTDVVKELGENQGKEAELVERGVAARDLLERIEIRAPTSGVIHQLSAHTIGGVIRAGDTIMELVPDLDDLQIEARLQPNDIDQVRMGQKAFVRFSAFNQRVTPQLDGMVSYVSADTSRDQQSNAAYFTVRVTLPEEQRRRLEGKQLVSGMPAEVFM
ncbi:MAG: HlyD family type I secretion periplasmic adaptor subunit, partial [Xanthobacteraceae bacterium]